MYTQGTKKTHQVHTELVAPARGNDTVVFPGPCDPQTRHTQVLLHGATRVEARLEQLAGAKVPHLE